EHGRDDFILVPHGLADLRARRGIPQARGLVRARCENSPAIGAERGGVDFRHLPQHKIGQGIAISPARDDRAPQMLRRRGILRIEAEGTTQIRDALAPSALTNEPLRGLVIPAARALLIFFDLVWGCVRLREDVAVGNCGRDKQYCRWEYCQANHQTNRHWTERQYGHES